MIINKRQRQIQGQSFLETLIGLSISGIAVTALIFLVQFFFKQQFATNSTSTIMQVAQIFAKNLQTPTSWNNTLNDPANATLTCFLNKTDCSGQSGPIRVDDYRGNPTNGYDPLASPSNGFTTNGTVCSTFNPLPGFGSDNCPYRLDITWQPECPSGGVACIMHPALVTGQWIYNPKTTPRTVAFNTGNYNFQVTEESPVLSVVAFVVLDPSLGGGPPVLPLPFTYTPLAELNVSSIQAIDQPCASPSHMEGLYVITWSRTFSISNYPVTAVVGPCPNPSTLWSGGVPPNYPADAFAEVLSTTATTTMIKSSYVGNLASNSAAGPCHSCAPSFLSVSAYDYQ